MSNRYLRVRRKQNRFSVMLIIIVLIMLMAVVSYNKHNLRSRCESYQKQEEMLLEQIAKEEARSEEIAEYAKYTKTKKFAEETAKQKLGLVHKGELIFRAK